MGNSVQILFVIIIFSGIVIIILSELVKYLRKKTNIYNDEEGKYYFAIHLTQVMRRLNDYEEALYDNKPVSRKKIYKFMALLLPMLCLGAIVAYQIFILVAISIWMAYGYCYIKFYQLWKMYGCSKLLFWGVTIGALAICFVAGPYIRTAFIGGLEALMNR